MKFLFFGMNVNALLGRQLKKAIYIEIPEKIIFLSGKLLSGLLEICFLESFNCKSNTISQSLEEFFRFALPASLSSLNFLATGLPESLGCDDVTLLGLVSYFVLQEELSYFTQRRQSQIPWKWVLKKTNRKPQTKQEDNNERENAGQFVDK